MAKGRNSFSRRGGENCTFTSSSPRKGSLALGSCQSSAYLTTIVVLSGRLKSDLN
jgi:hypothetical protein